MVLGREEGEEGEKGGKEKRGGRGGRNGGECGKEEGKEGKGEKGGREIRGGRGRQEWRRVGEGGYIYVAVLCRNKDYSVVYFNCITAFKTPYHRTSVKGGAHTRFVNSLAIYASTKHV